MLLSRPSQLLAAGAYCVTSLLALTVTHPARAEVSPAQDQGICQVAQYELIDFAAAAPTKPAEDSNWWRATKLQIDELLKRGRINQALDLLKQAAQKLRTPGPAPLEDDSGLAGKIEEKEQELNVLLQRCPTRREHTFEEVALRGRYIHDPGFILFTFFADLPAMARNEFAAYRLRQAQATMREQLRAGPLHHVFSGAEQISIAPYDFARREFIMNVDGYLFGGKAPPSLNPHGHVGFLLTANKPARLVPHDKYGLYPSGQRLRQLRFSMRNVDEAEEWRKTNDPSVLQLELVFRLQKQWKVCQRENQTAIAKWMRGYYQEQARKARGAAARIAQRMVESMSAEQLCFVGISYQVLGLRIYNTQTGQVLFSDPSSECKAVHECDAERACAGGMVCQYKHCLPPWRATTEDRALDDEAPAAEEKPNNKGNEERNGNQEKDENRDKPVSL